LRIKLHFLRPNLLKDLSGRIALERLRALSARAPGDSSIGKVIRAFTFRCDSQGGKMEAPSHPFQHNASGRRSVAAGVFAPRQMWYDLLGCIPKVTTSKHVRT